MSTDQRKLRMTTIITGMTYGGAQKIIIDLHRVLPECIEPEVIGLYPGEMVKFLVEDGVPTTEYNYRKLGMLLAIPRVWWHLRRTRPDVVMTHLGYADFVGRIAGKLAGVPIIVSCCHNVDDWKVNNFLNFLDNLSSRLADGILCVSDAARDYLVKRGQKRARIRLSHDRGELRERFATIGISEDKKAAYRAEFGITSDTVVSLMVGRLYPQKSHDVALKALRVVNRHGTRQPHVLLMAGDGPLRAETEAYAKKYLPSHSYRFLGNRDDIADLLAFADLFVMPSRWEGTPLALQEAFAAGMPALVSDIPSMSELVADCGGAIICPVENYKAMAREWVRLLDDENLRRQMARRGRENALAHWDIRNLRDEYFRYIAEIAERKLPRKRIPAELRRYRAVKTFCDPA